MFNKITCEGLTKEQIQQHEKDWGGYNSAPPGFQEITLEEFSQSGFFIWCHEGIESRQISVDTIDKAKLFSPVEGLVKVTLFYMNHGDNYAIMGEHWKKNVRYFKFARCYHEYRSMTEKEITERKLVHFGNGYHINICTKCGDVHEYDSSG